MNNPEKATITEHNDKTQRHICNNKKKRKKKKKKKKKELQQKKTRWNGQQRQPRPYFRCSSKLHVCVWLA